MAGSSASICMHQVAHDLVALQKPFASLTTFRAFSVQLDFHVVPIVRLCKHAGPLRMCRHAPSYAGGT